MTIAVRGPRMIGQGDALQVEVEDALDLDLSQCLECGKCTGGCSTGALFDYTPRKVVQLVKLGEEETLLRMDALSICVGCGLCRDRCPVGIDVAAILDYFRGKARLHGIAATRPQVELFNGLFLEGVRNRGRISELHLVARFNLRSRRYLKDADLGAQLFRRGKLKLFGRRVKDRAGLGRLFEGTAAETPVPAPRAEAEKDA